MEPTCVEEGGLGDATVVVTEVVGGNSDSGDESGRHSDARLATLAINF